MVSDTVLSGEGNVRRVEVQATVTVESLKYWRGLLKLQYNLHRNKVVNQR